jgi:MFS family permease
MDIPNMNKQSDKAGDLEINRGLALRTVSRLEAALEHSKVESSALTRWLLGALVAMNLVALTLVALLAPSLGTETVRQGLAAFSLGALIAFLAALVGALATVFITRMIRSAAGEWMDVATNDSDSAPAVAAARRMSRFANLWRAVLILAGLISLLLLLAGGLVLGQDIASPDFRGAVPVAAAAPIADDAASPGNVVEVASPDNSVRSVSESVVTEVPEAPTGQPPPAEVRAVPVPIPVPVAQRLAPQRQADAQGRPITSASAQPQAGKTGTTTPPKPAPSRPRPSLPNPATPAALPGADDPSG